MAQISQIYAVICNIIAALPYTVKLTRAKLPANSGNFIRELHV